MASAGWRKETAVAVDQQLARARALRPGQDVEELVLALALERHDTEHLARVQVERDVLQLRARGQAARRDPGRDVGRPDDCRARPSAAGMSSTIWPSISSTMRSSEPCVTSTTPTVSPSRRTVARSQTAAISIMRCEMKITELSPPSLPTDDLEHALGEVRRERGGHLIEHQDVRLDGQRAREVDDPQRGERHLARHARQVEVAQAELGEPVAERLERRLGEPQVGADVEVRDEGRFLVDRDEAAAAGLGRRVGDAIACPRTAIVPPSGRTAPVRILTSVLLPAPLAPISAWTSPGRTASEADCSATTAP